MPTSEIVRERALALAATSTPTAEAVAELEACCGGRRVSVVRARGDLQEISNGDDGSTEVGVALSYLDELLERLPA